MTALVLQPRPDTMPGFSSYELDDVHTPTNDLSYVQAAFLSSNASGMLCFNQTGPSDLSGSSWDTTVEGAQNFADYPDHGDIHPDAEDYSISYGQTTPRKPSGLMDEFQGKWSVVDTSISTEVLRRSRSKSSSGSSNGSKKRRAGKVSSSKNQTRIHSPMSHDASQVSGYDMNGNTLAAYSDVAMPNPRIGMDQYLMQESDALTGSALYPGLMGLSADGLPYAHDLASTLTQHVDPTCTQVHMDYEPSFAAHSPTGSWSSSSSGETRRSSPILDGTWSPPLHSGSPTETHESSSSPTFNGQSPRYVVTETSSSSPLASSHMEDFTRTIRHHGHQMMPEELSGSPETITGDEFALPPAFGSRRQSNEGDSARDHPLYKQAQPGADGLFHCPWEGQASCNHKAEKLKCNYDKFVDSHLKPYRCKHDSCENARFSSTACLLRHEREAHAMHGHGDKPYLCPYEACDRALHGNGFPRQWNLKDHMRRVHHDNGASLQTGPSSPPPSGNGHGKGRRKSGRKSSHKASSAAEERAAREASAYDEFQKHSKALHSLVSGFTQPDDPNLGQYIQEAQTHLSAINQISTGYGQGYNPRSFPQHSG